MAYLRYLFATASAVLLGVASVNFISDPAGVYRTHRNSSAYFANALVNSENGLWWPENSIEDRAIKEVLTKYSGRIQCVVVGSSHVMQIGSARKTKALEKTCSSILNLGVSGATIEDHLALVFLTLKSASPEKIVLGVDPWTFAYGKGQGWSFYASSYQDARSEILKTALSQGSDVSDGTMFWSKLRNLISLDYTIKSVRKMRSELGNPAALYAVTPVQILDETVGSEHPALFPDGSLNYSAKTIRDSLRPISLGGAVYLTDGAMNDRAAINAYKSLLKWIASKGVTPILLMTPYHHNVWKAPDSLNTRALKETEPIVRQIGEELGVEVIGSYNPELLGCLETEFYDYMHPKPECLARLESFAKH